MRRVKIVLFGSIIIIFLIGMLFSQPSNPPIPPEQQLLPIPGQPGMGMPLSPEKFSTIEEWMNKKSELENGIKESDKLDKEINKLITGLNEKKKDISTVSGELDRLVKRRGIADLSTELHRLIMRSDELSRMQGMMVQRLLISIPDVSNQLEKKREDIKSKLEELKNQPQGESIQTYKKQSKEIENQLQILKDFENKYKENLKLFDETLGPAQPYMAMGTAGPLLPGISEDETLLSKESLLNFDEEFKAKFNELPPARRVILWRLIKRIEKLDRENQFLLERANRNGEELKQIKELIKLGIDSKGMIPGMGQGMGPGMGPNFRGEMHRKKDERMTEPPVSEDSSTKRP